MAIPEEAPNTTEEASNPNTRKEADVGDGDEEIPEERHSNDGDGDGSGDEVEKDTDDDEFDDDSLPMQPEKLFFGPTEYSKACKIMTRCSVNNVVVLIEKLPSEVTWFRSHPQFKHVFHMAKESNHMTQGLWMLLLHTAYTNKQTECWFVVNGVPIRYSLREHALLCGFYCHDYSKDYKELGDLKFVKRQFGRINQITIAYVEEKLSSMRSCIDKRKMTVLYFLSKVVKAKSKADGNIDSFLLRVVDDLEVCKTFPLGRYTFDDSMKEIQRVIKNFNGYVKPNPKSCTFSGFILPLEIMAQTSTTLYPQGPILAYYYQIKL